MPVEMIASLRRPGVGTRRFYVGDFSVFLTLFLIETVLRPERDERRFEEAVALTNR